MTPQNIFSLVLFFLLLTGNHKTQFAATSLLYSPIYFVASGFSLILTPSDSVETNSVSEPNHDANSTMALVDTNQRSPLPNSYYAIRFLTADGTWRRHNGVAIQVNAMLSSDHILPSDVTPDDVVQIQITNPAGDVHDVLKNDFVIQPDHGYTIIVFRDPIISQENIASLGDADELSVGEVVYQSVVIGAEKGIYPTFVLDRFTAHENSPKEYSALRVSPDKTIVGDSGDPLYINGVVYGINNAGDGICGAITDPDAIYTTIRRLASDLSDLQKNRTAKVVQPHNNPIFHPLEGAMQPESQPETVGLQEFSPSSPKANAIAD